MSLQGTTNLENPDSPLSLRGACPARGEAARERVRLRGHNRSILVLRNENRQKAGTISGTCLSRQLAQELPACKGGSRV